MKAVMVSPDTPCYEGVCDKDGKLIQEEKHEEEPSMEEKKEQ